MFQYLYLSFDIILIMFGLNFALGNRLASKLPACWFLSTYICCTELTFPQFFYLWCNVTPKSSWGLSRIVLSTGLWFDVGTEELDSRRGATSWVLPVSSFSGRWPWYWSIASPIPFWWIMGFCRWRQALQSRSILLAGRLLRPHWKNLCSCGRGR